MRKVDDILLNSFLQIHDVGEELLKVDLKNALEKYQEAQKVTSKAEEAYNNGLEKLDTLRQVMNMNNIFKVKIGNYKWSIRFLAPDLMRENEYGTCWSLKRAIDIDASLDKEEAKIILGHELSHAFLVVAGKLHNKEFDEEEVCDFITWNIDQIMSIRDYVLRERFGV